MSSCEGIVKEREHSEDLSVDGTIVLKWL